MIKHVVLKIEGHVEQQDCRVTLEIGIDNQRPHIEKIAYLPANPDLARAIQEHWQDKYRQAGSPCSRKQNSQYSRDLNSIRGLLKYGIDYRIKVKRILHDGQIKRLKECQESADVVEKKFQEWIGSPSFQGLELCLREEVSQEDDIYITLRTDDRDIQKLPWHLWKFYQRYQRSEISLSPLVAARSNGSQRVPYPKVRILAILGHQDGIDVNKDREFLENLPNAEVTFLPEPKRQEINDKLWEQAWDIIFFAGHSETEGETGKIYINPDESLEIKDLWYGLRKAVDRGLKLAIFNSCDGLGLAQKIDDWQIPIAIVMRELVPDRVAQEFLKFFLDRFVQGVPFHLAVREAREQLQGLEGEFPCASWLPVICQHPTESLLNWEDFYQAEDSTSTSESAFSSVESDIVCDEKNEGKKKSVLPLWKPSFYNRLVLSIFAILLVGFNEIISPKLSLFFNQKGIFYVNELYRKNDEIDRSLYWRKAKFYINLAFILDSKNPKINNNLGYIYEDMTNLDKAKYLYELALKSGNSSSCNSLGRLSIIDGSYERAAKILIHCHNLVKTEEKRFRVLKNQGWLEYERQNYLQAIDFLTRAIDIAPENYEGYCLLSLAQDKLNKTDLAIPNASKCIEFSQDKYALRSEEQQWRQQNLEILEKTQKK